MSSIENEDFDLNLIKEGFEIFDIENTGKINPIEIKEIMEEINLKSKNPFIYELISSLCSKKEIIERGGITSDEFIFYLKEKLSDTESKKGIKTLFNVFSDVDDKIPMPSFYQTGKEIGDEKNSNEIKKLVEMSHTQSKELNFNEFYDIMREKDNNNYNDKNLNKNKNDIRVHKYEINYEKYSTYNTLSNNNNDNKKVYNNTYKVNNVNNRSNNYLNKRYNDFDKSNNSNNNNEKEMIRYHRNYRTRKNNSNSDNFEENKLYINYRK